MLFCLKLFFSMNYFFFFFFVIFRHDPFSLHTNIETFLQSTKFTGNSRFLIYYTLPIFFTVNLHIGRHGSPEISLRILMCRAFFLFPQTQQTQLTVSHGSPGCIGHIIQFREFRSKISRTCKAYIFRTGMKPTFTWAMTNKSIPGLPIT